MIQVRPASSRGHFDHGWLDTFHTFSFADYRDPEFMGFRSLRVINEDRVSAAEGFGTHGHRDMEILTYVLSGALKHQDSLGNGSTILPGDAQYMSAGSGVEHSEFNGSETEVCHFYQIWILPNVKGAPPRYDQKRFALEEKRDRLRLIASPDGAQGSIAIRQDARVYACVLDQGREVSHSLAEGRFAYVQVARGTLTLNGNRLTAGDGAAVSRESALQIRGEETESELLVFDLD